VTVAGGCDALSIDFERGILTLTNNDPPRNRMTFEYMDAVEQAVTAAANDPSVRALVFTAMGDEHFSVGMDLKQLMSGAAERGGTHAVLDQRLRVLRAIETMGKPSIATLFGYCLGGGLGGWCRTAGSVGADGGPVGSSEHPRRAGHRHTARPSKRPVKTAPARSWLLASSTVSVVQVAHPVGLEWIPRMARRARLAAAARRLKSASILVEPRMRARRPPWRWRIRCPSLRSTLGRVAR